MTDLFVNRTNAILAKVLDGAAERQKALADNIANVDTPGYTRKEVSLGCKSEIRYWMRTRRS